MYLNWEQTIRETSAAIGYAHREKNLSFYKEKFPPVLSQKWNVTIGALLPSSGRMVVLLGLGSGIKINPFCGDLCDYSILQHCFSLNIWFKENNKVKLTFLHQNFPAYMQLFHCCCCFVVFWIFFPEKLKCRQGGFTTLIERREVS